MKKCLYLIQILVFSLGFNIVYAGNIALCFLNGTGKTLQVNYPESSTGVGPNNRIGYVKLYQNERATVSFETRPQSFMPKEKVYIVVGPGSEGAISTGNGTYVIFAFFSLYMGRSGLTYSPIIYNDRAIRYFKTYCEKQLKDKQPLWWPRSW